MSFSTNLKIQFEDKSQILALQHYDGKTENNFPVNTMFAYEELTASTPDSYGFCWDDYFTCIPNMFKYLVTQAPSYGFSAKADGLLEIDGTEIWQEVVYKDQILTIKTYQSIDESELDPDDFEDCEMEDEEDPDFDDCEIEDEEDCLEFEECDFESEQYDEIIEGECGPIGVNIEKLKYDSKKQKFKELK